MEEKSKYSADDIQSLSRAEWFELRLFKNAEIDPLYVIIGFLQEYFGGYSPNEEVVDVFFVNESKKAHIFKQLCEFYLAANSLANDVEFLVVDSGHSYLKSKIICQKLKGQFLVKKPDFLNHKCFHLAKENDLFKTAEELYGNRKKMFNYKRYSFLLGVMIRNKLEGKPAINFANAGEKATLTIEILNEFSAFGDTSFKVEYFFNVPHVTRVSLSEGNAIWGQVKEYVGILME